ncbi:tripartite tricarboxylate transporter TctB family protein [Aureimonas jatrophae]|uniref:Putative tricarboxylic transport membrane protein n=1 Tax=Aureimonas jatrophae TaxID=1166073 RepID=A0A1H0EP27_9HYPH|nr:tripartite tricarboxylate transporter TctB family protein [Aureimonas jatrophae]MBB3950398.1 putative tricarboxylic transport membrane protein [Aureimonas jatrophae]SDN84108.1 putative tricarboxylic transport membrane protein [Aureimonas jatrophae]
MTHPVSTQDERRPDRAALLIGVALGILGALVLLDAQSVRGGAYARIGPATFPTVIGAFLVILSVWTMISAWRGRFPEREPSDTAPVVWIVAGLALQLLLLHPAGFSIATGILFALTARAFGKRKLWISLPAGILFSLAIWLLFTQVLRLALPAGPLEQLFT